MAKISLRAVADVLQRLAPRDAGGGGRGDVYVMTDQGRLILRSRVGSAELMRTKVPAATTQALLDREGSTVEYKRADGQDVIGTLRRGAAARRGAGGGRAPAAAVWPGGGGGGGGGGGVLAVA